MYVDSEAMVVTFQEVKETWLLFLKVDLRFWWNILFFLLDVILFTGRVLSAAESIELAAMAAVMYIKDKIVSTSFKNQTR